MTDNRPRIVFMGTPEFAVPSLQALIEHGFHVVGVVTATDKPAGRGRHMSQPPVKRVAEEKKIPVLQPDSLKDPYFLEELDGLQADLFVVVAFRMLPEQVWQMPSMGTVNLHASLLPQYRGAAPINWVLIHGEKQTGITTFLIEKEIDTGNILLQETIQLNHDINAGELHDILMIKGADLLRRTLIEMEKGSIHPVPQSQLMSEKTIIPAPKISREDGKIDWAKSSDKLHNLIRGMSPSPGAWTQFLTDNGFSVGIKILQTELVEDARWGQVGDVLVEGTNRLFIQCGTGTLRIKKLQPAGKKIMGTPEFLRGLREEIVRAE